MYWVAGLIMWLRSTGASPCPTALQYLAVGRCLCRGCYGLPVLVRVRQHCNTWRWDHVYAVGETDMARCGRLVRGDVARHDGGQ